MPIVTAAQDTEVILTASSGQDEFSFSWPIFSDEELIVLVDGVANDNYTVSGVGNANGGTITLSSPLTAGQEVTLARDVPIYNTLDLPSTGPYDTNDIDNEVDRIYAILQQHETKFRRVPMVDIGEISPDIDISTLVEGNVLAYVGGQIIGISALAGSTVAAQTAAAAALVSQTAAAASATSAAGSATSAATSLSGAQAAKTGAETARTGAEAALTGANTALAVAVISGIVGGRIYLGRAALNADLTPNNGEYALVYGDATAANNDVYKKNGATGTGNWGNPLGFFAAASSSAQAYAAAAAAAYGRYLSPFEQAVSDSYMRSIVEDIWIEGAPAGHQHILNIETLNLGSGNGRVTFRIRNITLGIDIAIWQKIDTQANFNARTSPTVFAFQGALPAYTGMYVMLTINWAAVTNWAIPLTTYTTAAQAGIRTNRIMPRDRVRDFRLKAEPKIRLTVGAGTVTATHFNTYQAAIASLYIPGVTITRSTFPCSDICSFSNQVVVECIDDNYSEQITPTTIGGVDQSPVLLPPYITLRGKQDGNTRIFMNHATNGAPVIEAPFPFRIEHLTIENMGKGYALHVDNANGIAKRAATGPAFLWYSMISVVYKSTLKTGTAQATWNYGCGISNGHTVRFEQARIIGAAALPFIGIHNTASTTDAGDIEIIDTYVNDNTIPGSSGLQLVKGATMALEHRVNIKGTKMGSFTAGNSVGTGTIGFIQQGSMDSAIVAGGTALSI